MKNENKKNENQRVNQKGKKRTGFKKQRELLSYITI